ncbi:RapZ C-terminal domain-containing protein [Actinomadura coerulea]|uniref:RapZ C-terminal domain-containing protein n=1 Tax=Actinomadura coerulea TaxID=46159 RepID=UPI00341AAB22
MHEIAITTFGYLHDAPPSAHITLDLRTHFRDPHVDPALRSLTAHDAAVRDAVHTTPGIPAVIDAAAAAVRAYLAGPSDGPVTVAVGCAGGRHRAASVGIALADALTDTTGQPVTLVHRDLGRPVVDRPNLLAGLPPAVPEHLRPWTVPWSSYAPVDITPPELQPGAGLDASVADGWAEPATDPAALPDLAERRAAALIPFQADAQGRPLHPGGRTGKTGRDLGRWGENRAVDSIVVAGTGPYQRVLLIRRADCGAWALPGGMVEPGESDPAALVRELAEETGVDLDGFTPRVLARTPVDDPRQSDHAWVATTAALFRLPDVVPAISGDDAVDAAWFPFATGPHTLDELDAALADLGGVLYPAHRALMATALAHLILTAHDD